MQNDSNAKAEDIYNEFIKNCGLKRAKDIVKFAPEGSRYWVLTTGYHNDLPEFSQYKFQHFYSLSELKNCIEEYESIHGVNFGIPECLLCEPRTYKVKLNSDHEYTCDLGFTVVIKCTGDQLHEHNNFWCENEERLDSNDGDIVAVILKMIGRKVFWYCYEHNTQSLSSVYGVNSIFRHEGWSPLCFEITELNFNSHVDDEDFEFELVTVEN